MSVPFIDAGTDYAQAADALAGSAAALRPSRSPARRASHITGDAGRSGLLTW
jgi:hypothetical protein